MSDRTRRNSPPAGTASYRARDYAGPRTLRKNFAAALSAAAFRRRSVGSSCRLVTRMSGA